MCMIHFKQRTSVLTRSKSGRSNESITENMRQEEKDIFNLKNVALANLVKDKIKQY